MNSSLEGPLSLLFRPEMIKKKKIISRLQKGKEGLRISWSAGFVYVLQPGAWSLSWTKYFQFLNERPWFGLPMQWQRDPDQYQAFYPSSSTWENKSNCLARRLPSLDSLHTPNVRTRYSGWMEQCWDLLADQTCLDNLEKQFRQLV